MCILSQDMEQDSPFLRESLICPADYSKKNLHSLPSQREGVFFPFHPFYTTHPLVGYSVDSTLAVYHVASHSPFIRPAQQAFLERSLSF